MAIAALVGKGQVNSEALSGSGKVKPKKCGCSKSGKTGGTCKCDGEGMPVEETMEPKEAVAKSEEPAPDPSEEETVEEAKKVFVSFEKALDEEQLVTGIALQPEVVDAQGDIYSSDVIKKAAHKFLANYNSATKLGHQHKFFNVDVDLVESYIAPMDFALGTKIIKAGSWVVTVKVHDKKLWKKIKNGEIAGFSIGGKAKVKKLQAA
jgi:hypothetical protein